MQKNLNKTVLSLVVILLVLAGGNIQQYFVNRSILKQHNERAVDLRKKEKQIKMKSDSINDLQEKIQAKTTYWLAVQEKYRDSLRIDRQQSTKWRKEYAKVKNTPPPAWNDRQLDSLLSVIIR